MSYPPGQGSGQGQDDWGAVPGSGSQDSSRPNLRKDESSGSAADYGPTQVGPTYQGGSSDPYGQGSYGGGTPYGNPPEQGWDPAPPSNPYAADPYAAPPGSSPYGSAPGYGQAPAYGSAAYGQNPYGAQPYGAGAYGYGTPQSTNGKSIAAMVCGIVGLISVVACIFFSGLLSIPTGIAAVVLGFMSRKEVEQSNGTQTGSGMALTGIITGALAILGGVVWIVLLIILMAAGNSLDEVSYY